MIARRARAKEMKKEGWPKPTTKPKAQPFPRPNKDVDMSMVTQHKLFHGLLSKRA